MAAEIPIADRKWPGTILISACLMGHKVRYDGGHQVLGHPLIRRWQQAGRLVPCCPEVLGGLPTPRPPAEICGGGGQDVWQGTAAIQTAAGADLTVAFKAGARAALALVRKHGIQLAILSQRSPSCGSERIYDGRFEGHLIPGIGVTTALLRAHAVTVIGPERIEELEND